MLNYTLYINGSVRDYNVGTVYHEMYAENHADSLELTLNDPKGTRAEEGLRVGDTVRFVYGNCDTGTMYVTRVEPQWGKLVLLASALPLTAPTIRYKSWEGTTLFSLCREITHNHGLIFSSYSSYDPKYTYIKQDGISDFKFLNDLANLEACSILLFDGRLVLYSQYEQEHRRSAKPIAVGYDGDYIYENNAGKCYGTFVLTAGEFTAEVTDSTFDENKVLTVDNISVADMPTAQRFVRGIRRSVNKNVHTGVINTGLLADVCAASIIELCNNVDRTNNDLMFVTRVRQSYLQGETKIWFRRPYGY